MSYNQVNSNFYIPGVATNAELGYLSGVTSAIQTQLNAKEATANKGIANGYASLDATTKVPLAQLGNTTAQWNADKIRGTNVDATAIASTYVFQYDGTDIVYVNPLTAFINLSLWSYIAGRSGNQSNGYLRTVDSIVTNLAEYIVPYDATIIAIAATCSSAVNEWRAEVRLALSASYIASLVLTNAQTSNYNNVLSVNVSAGNTLSIYLQKGPAGDGTGTNIPDPKVEVWLKRR